MATGIGRGARKAAVVIGLVAASAAAGRLAPAQDADPRTAPIFPRFETPILEHPLVVTGTFGEHRSNHFHAGLDLDTRGQVGWPVHVPMDGQVVRLRSSGVGYGRSIYIETTDGRLLVFGHLDAFAEPFASYLAGRQDTTGMYEQDLWPELGRFKVRAGDVIAWSGQSGGGGPHLHIEVRRGDMAMHPLRAGYAVPDTIAPRIFRATLVPLGDSSWVAGESRPKVLELSGGALPATGAWGRLRVVVEAMDADGSGAFDVVPWRVRVSSSSGWVECRFDSVSWATDMAQSDFVYDRGRYTARGTTSLVLASPGVNRPRVIDSSIPRGREAGVVVLDETHLSDAVTIEAEDLAGRVTRRSFAVRAERAASSAKGSTAGAKSGGAAAGPRVVRNIMDLAARDSVVLPDLAWLRLPGDALFEPTRITLERTDKGQVPAGLEAVGVPVAVIPMALPLRIPVEFALPLPAAGALSRIGLYRDIGDGWEFVTDAVNAQGTSVVGQVRRLGRFCLFRDTVLPRVTLFKSPSSQPPGPYPRWAIAARDDERGSGVDPFASRIEIDGLRAPTEWDPEANVLRWRPLRLPARGSHRVAVVATDRAGNIQRTEGTVVIR